ncbi:flagellar biosynthetic protein FliO [Pseudidiomarina insulisalsae]|uniref:Flagellar protein n=1 Tax=Pseudidiomarina insulisalsae TaxID=575789 RepID=A0A432YDH7_9GAMM|nr:flagellar biosynthetic protein FliO [Pseudidiomarina insulisalsae]RUO59048.1 flagellar biosynthetic protein FliO [Pseudidiomarina insulisalsae]
MTDTNAVTAPPLSDNLALFAQVATVLIFIVALIFLCGWLFKRVSQGAWQRQQQIKCVASLAVGSKERVVIIEVEQQRLLLGVSAQGIQKLAELSPVPPGNTP